MNQPYKKINNDKFDYEKIKKLALLNIRPNIIKRFFMFFKKDSFNYGDDIVKDYQLKMQILDETVKECRRRGWVTKKQWNDHNVNMIQIINDMNKSLIKYSDILRFYAKKAHDGKRLKLSTK